MTDTPTIPRLDLARQIVNRWARALGIDDWRINVVVGRDLDGANATASTYDNYDASCIEVQPYVLGLTDPPPIDEGRGYAYATDDMAFEELLVHELLHVLMRRRSKAQGRIRDQLPEGLRDAYRVLSDDADEEIVDRLARVLVRVSATAPEKAPCTCGLPGCASSREAVRW